jgi:hypothetical protein
LIEHLLHAWPPFRAFIADHHYVTWLDLISQDVLDGLILTLDHVCRPFEHQQAFIDAGGLHHATFRSDVAAQDSETTIRREAVLD